MKKNDIIRSTFAEYKLLEQIGSGGNACVWKAKYVVNDQEVAIKFLEKKNDEKFKRYCNEAIFSMRNVHENIIHMYDSGECENFVFAVMDVADFTLRKLIEYKNITNKEIKEIFDDILEGLIYLHGKEVIHRDLKPENILIFKKRNGFRAVIADLGIAHFREYPSVENQTESADRMGNRDYSAPEQRVRPYKYTYATDIYTLGMILHEMFTGDFLTPGQHRTIEQAAPEYGYLDSIVEKACAKNAHERYENAIELKKDLRKIEDSFLRIPKDFRGIATFIDNRIKEAIPKAPKGYRITDTEEILNRLKNLFRSPINNGRVGEGELNFFTVLGSQGDNFDVESFLILDQDSLLVANHYIKPTFLYSKTFQYNYLSYVYIETDIDEEDDEELGGVPFSEKYYWNGQKISKEEYDAGVIDHPDGNTEIVERENLSFRMYPRCKQKYVIIAKSHPLNDSKFQKKLTEILNINHDREQIIKDLKSYIERLPRPRFY